MAARKLSDAAAKQILRRWPNRTKKLWRVPDNSGYWLRAQPSDATVRAPRLSAPGARLFTTQPDGLWIYLTKQYCDVVAIEVCGTIQNLNDKRSRYIPGNHSVVVDCRAEWLQGQIRTARGGLRARWEMVPSFDQEPSDQVLPVRHLRVLYSIPNNEYDRWTPEHVPAGYEFFCPHSSLDSYTSQKMQEFLRQMSIRSHYYV